MSGASMMLGAALEELVPPDFDEPPFAGAYMRTRALVASMATAVTTSAPAAAPRMARASLRAGKRVSRSEPVEVSDVGEAHTFSAWTTALDVRLALASFDLRALGTRRLAVSMRSQGRSRVNVDVTGLDAASARLFANALPQRLRRAARRWGSLALHVDIRNGRAA
jgi:hypothetical protein